MVDIQSGEACLELVSKLKKFQEEKEYVDVAVQFPCGTVINAHKSVLAAASR